MATKFLNLDTDSTFTADSDYYIPSQKAVKTALDTKIDKVTDSSKIYGTDASGNQTTYNLADISSGGVADVTVGGVSVVTDNVAALGSMASETATDYVKTSVTINNKALTGNITLDASDVNALPSDTSIPTKVSDLTNDSGFITGISSSDVTTALGFNPYDASNPDGYTSNVGTITGITMNGESLGTSGVIDLGTVITDISGKQDAITESNKLSASLVSGLGAVATSNDYNSLDNKPTIPSEVTEATVADWGFTKNAGTVTKVNNIEPVNGNVTLSIPTITDTYSSTSSDGMSGKAVASAVSGLANEVTFRAWS